MVGIGGGIITVPALVLLLMNCHNILLSAFSNQQSGGNVA
jgi:uncharacterized membrane protein YfcA